MPPIKSMRQKNNNFFLNFFLVIFYAASVHTIIKNNTHKKWCGEYIVK